MATSAHRSWFLGSILLLALAGGAAGQPVVEGTARIAFDRPESWAMARTGSLTSLSGFGAPREREPWSMELGLEVASIPHVSRVERRVGFGGTKIEEMNQAPILARPRLEVGLPWALTLSLGYLPPVRVFDVEPNLLALSLGRPVLAGEAWTVGLRLHGQMGRIRATVTCPADVVAYGDDPVNNPFGCEAESWDETTIRSAGLEVAAAYRIDSWRGLTPHLAVAAHRFDTEFQVNALTFGFRDRLRLTTKGSTLALSGGFRLPVGRGTDLGVDLFYSPLRIVRPDEPRRTEALFNVRALVGYRVR